MGRCLFLLLAAFLLFGCKEEKAKLTISEEKLVHILADMHIAEAALFTVDIKQKDSIAAIYYSQIYDKHQITDSVLQENIFVLKDDYKKMHEIYKRVAARNDKIEKESTKNKKK